MKPEIYQSEYAIKQSQQYLRAGDKLSARRWAEKAASLTPDYEEPWLLLAACASSKASISYLKQALEINPKSVRARKGMHWAVKRYRREAKPVKYRFPNISSDISRTSFIKSQPVLFPWMLIILALLIGIGFWFGTPTLSLALTRNNAVSAVNTNLQKATQTPTPTTTATATPTVTPTLTPSPTHIPTDTPTPEPTETDTPQPTDPPTQAPDNSYSSVNLPPGVEKGERWIDIDLTNQRIYAYQGKNTINSFIVSTGTWIHPTVVGQYRIYVKYVYADMSGPGYYLPDVPYVMYFYKGYGIHGTYWHNNFGTPMSHGCVNLRTPDAEWMFYWSSIGTLVNIHY
jgi:lipoprotein-anchoring transpeptidase ErfK/SrfK